MATATTVEQEQAPTSKGPNADSHGAVLGNHIGVDQHVFVRLKLQGPFLPARSNELRLLPGLGSTRRVYRGVNRTGVVQTKPKFQINILCYDSVQASHQAQPGNQHRKPCTVRHGPHCCSYFLVLNDGHRGGSTGLCPSSLRCKLVPCRA